MRIVVNHVAQYSHVISTRHPGCSVQKLSRNELDLLILGQLAALLTNCDNTTAHRLSGRRQRSLSWLSPDKQGSFPEAAWLRQELEGVFLVFWDFTGEENGILLSIIV